MFGVGRAADMAIVDTVWGRLTRFNAPRRSPGDGPSLPLRLATLALRSLVLVGILVLNALLALGGVLGKFLTRFTTVTPRPLRQERRRRYPLPSLITVLRLVVLACVAGAVGWAAL